MQIFNNHPPRAGVGKATLGKGTRVFAAAVEGAATGCDSTNGNDGGTVHPGEGLAGVLVTGDQQQAFCDAHKRVVEALQGRSVVAALGELRYDVSRVDGAVCLIERFFAHQQAN
jgi:hypothetical protein